MEWINGQKCLLRNMAFMVLLAAALILCATPLAFAESATPLDRFQYTLDSKNGTVMLTKYTGSEVDVVVPGTYEIDGKAYDVQLCSTSVFRSNTKIKSAKICDGVGFYAETDSGIQNNSMYRLFSDCSNLKNVDLSQADTTGVTDMSFLFYKCQKLEKVDMTGLETADVTTMRAMFYYGYKVNEIKGLSDFDTSSLLDMYMMFNRAYVLKEIDLSGWDLDQVKNTGWCFQNARAEKILLPDNLAVMSAGFFNHATGYKGTSFTIPVGVKKIGYAHTIYDFATNSFTDIKVTEGNRYYKAVDGILYSADGREMLAIPRAKTFKDNTYVMPEGVTFIAELSFSRNYNIHKLVLPDSYTMDQHVPLNDPRYIVYEDLGNINEGNSLSIGIYQFTGVKEYAVKSSNPRYASRDGILYSKDMKELTAIPTRYDGILEIPEGVKTWKPYAMWTDTEVYQYMNAWKGVRIPASMTSIHENQIKVLNDLKKKYPNFSIVIAEGNPVVYLDENGILRVLPNILDAEIILEQNEYQYDGQEKRPAVTVMLGDKQLTEGVDYEVSYRNNTMPGKAVVIVTGIGQYHLTKEVEFTILKPETIDTTVQNLENIPDTGDDSILAVWIALNLIAVAAYGWIRRKQYE